MCWESKTFLCTVSGADSITLLPHQGYLIRTQPNNHLQAQGTPSSSPPSARKRVFVISIQAPFSQSDAGPRSPTCCRNTAPSVIGALIYEKDKTTYRSEIDQALRAKPDIIYLNGYAPDVTVVTRDLYRAGYRGRPKCRQSYA